MSTEDISTSRTWVDSETFPLFAREGYRVLHNRTIFVKTGNRFFGKWKPSFDQSDYNEIVIRDEAIIR